MISAISTVLGQAMRRWQASRRCVMGEGAVVYSPRSVNVIGGGRERIALGSNTVIRGELLALPGGSITLGDFCYLGENSRIWSYVRVRVGHRVLIAHNVSIMDSLTHPIDPLARHEHFRRIIFEGHPADLDLGARPVEIRDDAWIACNAVILRGVVIGEAAIVAAGAVVTKDVPPRTLVAGNPARVVRELALDEVRSAEIDRATPGIPR